MAHRILVLTSSYPTCAGSVASAFLADWASALALRGHRLTILAPHDPHHPPSACADVRVAIVCFRYSPIPSLQTLAYGSGMYDNVLVNPLRVMQLPGLLASFYRSAIRLARCSDVMHAHWLFPAGLIGVLVKQQLGTPLIVTVHSTDYHLLRRLPGGRFIARLIVKHADRLHFVTAFHRRLFDEWMKADRLADHRCYVSPMGVPDTFISPPAWPLASRPRLGFLGRLISLKGADRLLRSCASLGAWPVAIAGCGPEQQRLASLGRQLRLPITFVGAVSGSEKVRFIDSCDVMVFPSRRCSSGRTEGLPVSMLEALARGRVVVAADSGGIPDVVRHQRNGYLFRAEDDDALTETLSRILAGWPRSADVAAAARHSVTALTASAVARTHDAVYRAVLADAQDPVQEGSA
jgi:glycosyltransferase involved in cell wall biosynthesis